MEVLSSMAIGRSNVGQQITKPPQKKKRKKKVISYKRKKG
jgi:hypothetical protein|tara:strand:- start:586 stop:705 length:120 start_codon:yes stop_codon:yes gene_type:complete